MHSRFIMIYGLDLGAGLRARTGRCPVGFHAWQKTAAGGTRPAKATDGARLSRGTVTRPQSIARASCDIDIIDTVPGLEPLTHPDVAASRGPRGSKPSRGDGPYLRTPDAPSFFAWDGSA